MLFRPIAAFLLTLLLALPAQAAQCGGNFNAFLGQIAHDAQSAGISRSVIESAFAGVTPDSAVLAFDHRQHGTFRMSFERYAATRVIPARINRAKRLMAQHAADGDLDHGKRQRHRRHGQVAGDPHAGDARA